MLFNMGCFCSANIQLLLSAESSVNELKNYKKLIIIKFIRLLFMASSCPVEVRSSILCPDYDKHSHDAHSIMNDGEEDYQVQVLYTA